MDVNVFRTGSPAYLVNDRNIDIDIPDIHIFFFLRAIVDS